MKSILITMILSLTVNVFAQQVVTDFDQNFTFNASTDLYCKNTDKPVQKFALVLKNAVVSEPTSYILIERQAKKWVPIKSQHILDSQDVRNRGPANLKLTAYVGCELVEGRCAGNEFALLRTITLITNKPSTYTLGYRTSENNGNYDLNFICKQKKVSTEK